MRILVILALVALLGSTAASPALAAGNAEISVISNGSFAIEKGWHDAAFPIAQGTAGPLPMAFVMVASRPYVEASAPYQLEDENDPFAPPVVNPQVPGVIKIKIGDRTLPDWTLEPKSTAYVISWDSLRRNSSFQNAMIGVNISLESEATAVRVTMLSMPEFVQLIQGDAAAYDGPLSGLVGSLKDDGLKNYFTALSKEIAGDIPGAKSDYESLARSPKADLARFARRGLRMISYHERPHKLSGNIMEHYRWGLYLQFAGIYAPAFTEFEELRIIDSRHADGQFRAGECRERLGDETLNVIHYFNRCGEATTVEHPMFWNILVTLVKTRGGKSLTEEEIIVIKDSFVILERTLWAASHGTIRLGASFFEIEQESAESTVKHLNRVTGPPDDLIAERGWYDSVFYIRPRIDGEDRNSLESAGHEVGPNGSAAAAFFHDAPFSIYLKAAYSHLFASATAAGRADGWPSPEAAQFGGFQPGRFASSGLRSTMRYYISAADFARVAGCDERVPDSFLQLWRLEGPVAGPAGDDKSAPGMEWPESSSTPVTTIVSDDDFIDLRRKYPDAANARVRATSWVYSPEKQVVGVRLGRNDRATLALNGRVVLAAPSLAGSKFEGRNLVDTAFTRETLEKGWNEVQVVVASRPSEKNKDFGFSVSLTTLDAKPVPGLACINIVPPDNRVARSAPPKVGDHYDWADVEQDFHRMLPRLGEADLRTITGVADLRLRQGGGANPYIAMEAPGRKPDSTYRAASEMGGDGARDFALNNVLDLSREALAAFRYKKADENHDLIVVRPEALDAVRLLLKEPESAGKVFKDRTLSQRLLGWIDVGEMGTLFVLDSRIADNDAWPIDEEDLLTPYGPFVPNWPDEFREGPPSPDSPQSTPYQLPT